VALPHALTQAEARIAAIKADLRERGWFVRYTEWPLGHQVVLHRRSDTARHLVTDWHGSELEAWEAALRLASTTPSEAAPTGSIPGSSAGA
jgi:hypothetical protein